MKLSAIIKHLEKILEKEGDLVVKGESGCVIGEIYFKNNPMTDEREVFLGEEW